MFQKIGFIGTGNMGGALAKAADRGAGAAAQLFLSNRTPEKAQVLAGQLARAQVSTNEQIAKTCEIIFLGVKPQMMAQTLAPLYPILAKRTDRFVVCSMAAGLSLDTLSQMLGGTYPMIRILPNTPAAIGQGIAQYCVRGVDEQEKQDFLKLMQPSGILDEMDEHMMAIANCITGCGVAFAAMFIEALADGAVACGLSRQQAMECAAQTMAGTGALYLSQKQHPEMLKDAVCSPAGVTIQGVRALEKNGFRSACFEAVCAAYEKVQQMT